MNYRLQASVLGLSLILVGAAILIFAIDLSLNATSPVEGSVVAFVGLGLILTGSLTTFATPQSLVASEIVSRALSPSAENFALIFSSILPQGFAVHVPQLTLGGGTQVFLVISEGNTTASSKEARIQLAPKWHSSGKVLEPTGIALMEGYERVLKRDFLELDLPQLARLLSRAVVPELQLASGFAFRELSQEKVEAVWTKPTVDHTCLSEGSYRADMCCLCSSIACAIAKATGKPVQIEQSNLDVATGAVKTTYQIHGVA